MKAISWNLPRLLTALAFALLCFCVGYLTPHRHAALAQSPEPRASVDDVPGGGHGHGVAFVTGTVATKSAMLIAQQGGWACAKSNQNHHCNVSFRFRVTPQGSAAPKPYVCPREPTCFSFMSSDFQYQREDPSTGDVTETHDHVQITGMFQLEPVP
jgi:hypothetical protein